MGPSQGRRRAGPRIGGRKGDVYRIGGVDIPWDPDLDFDKPKPVELFPEFQVEKPKPLSEVEKLQIGHFRKLREKIHKGPLHTTLSDHTRINKPGVSAAATFDAFNSMPKYSSRYLPKPKILPRLEKRPFVLKFFPEELWAILDPSRSGGEGEGSLAARRKGEPSLGKDKAGGITLDALAISDEEGNEPHTQDPEDDEGTAEDEVDDEYDDEDEGGDYDAEQYFDDGGDDGVDDVDAGEDGGMDYF